MSQKPNIPSQYLPQPCGTAPRITIFTGSTQQLYLIYTTHEPRRRPRFKTIRGLSYECGREWHLEDAICIPQSNLATKNYHIFALPSQVIGTCIWYALTTSCDPNQALSKSPPIKYCYVACPANSHMASVSRGFLFNISTGFQIPWQTLDAGDASAWNGGNDLIATAAGSYNLSGECNIRGDHNLPGTSTWELDIESNIHGVIEASSQAVIAPNEVQLLGISTSVNAASGERFRLNCLQVTGAGGMESIGNGGVRPWFKIQPL